MLRGARFRGLVLWLAIAGLALRGLIPAGFMPGWTGDTHAAPRSWLTICPAGELAVLLPGAHAHHHHGGGAHGDEHAGHILAEAHQSCPYAAAAAPALPHPFTAFERFIGAVASVDGMPPSRPISAPSLWLPPARGPPVSPLVHIT